MIQTEYEFTLPIGYPDEDGNLHRDGVMRLATAADEITPLRHRQVQSNPAYLIVILLSSVVKNIGSFTDLNPSFIEGLFAADLAYLQNLYNEINHVDQQHLTASCPQCQHKFTIEKSDVGGL